MFVTLYYLCRKDIIGLRNEFLKKFDCFTSKNEVFLQIPSLHICPCGILYCTFKGTLLAVENLCEVLAKYTVGINYSCIQFKSALESIKAMKVD